MKRSAKYIALLLGILSVIFSFLFFDRNNDLYQILAAGGMTLAGISYLVILFGQSSWRLKLIWTVAVALGIMVQQASEPVLIDASYRIYLNQHGETLERTNAILNRMSGKVTVLNDSVYDQPAMSETDRKELLENRQILGVYMIAKNDSSVDYGMYGFLDVRHWLTCWKKKEAPDDRYRHVRGNWYR